jgi:hypothetical protein
MTEETQQEAGQGTESQDLQEKTFGADYVKQLREEAKQNRIKAQEFQEQLNAILEKQKADEQAKLEQQGEFQKLAEERQKEIERLASYEAQVTQLTEAAKASNEKLIEQVPEDKRGLIPEYDPLKLQQWLTANQSVLIGQTFTPPSTNGGAGTYQKSNGQHKPLTQTELAIAKNMGLTPEQYQEGKAKSRG